MDADAIAIERLNQYRLKNDLTYDALAAEMTAAGHPLKPRALCWMLSGRLVGLPRDRTRHKIREFLALVKGAKQRKPKRRVQ